MGSAPETQLIAATKEASPAEQARKPQTSRRKSRRS
jgi:hypothetical protein